MKLSRILFILIPFFLIQCVGENSGEDVIRYSELEELETEIIMEAGESEDYFPTRLDELIVASDGSILISDPGSTTLEQLSPDGEHLQTVATEGNGPGELTQFFHIADLGNDRVMVEHTGSKRDIFALDDHRYFIYETTLSSEDNGGYGYNIIGRHTGDEYYARPRNVIRDVQTLMAGETDYQDQLVVIIDESNNLVRDSLHVLQSALPHITDAGNGGFRVDVIPYRYVDRFVPLQGGDYILARPDDSRLEFYDMDHNLTNVIELNVAPREITRSDMDYAFRDHRDDVIRDIEPRLHEFKPPFLDILASENHLCLHTDNSEQGKEFVVLQMDGTPVGKFMLSEYDEPKRVIGNRIYALHLNPDLGHSVRVYEVEL